MPCQVWLSFSWSPPTTFSFKPNSHKLFSSPKSKHTSSHFIPFAQPCWSSPHLIQLVTTIAQTSEHDGEVPMPTHPTNNSQMGLSLCLRLMLRWRACLSHRWPSLGAFFVLFPILPSKILAEMNDFKSLLASDFDSDGLLQIHFHCQRIINTSSLLLQFLWRSRFSLHRQPIAEIPRFRFWIRRSFQLRSLHP